MLEDFKDINIQDMLKGSPLLAGFSQGGFISQWMI